MVFYASLCEMVGRGPIEEYKKRMQENPLALREQLHMAPCVTDVFIDKVVLISFEKEHFVGLML